VCKRFKKYKKNPPVVSGDFSLLIYSLSFTKNHPAAFKKVAKIEVEIVCCLHHLKNESKTELITDQYFLKNRFNDNLHIWAKKCRP